MTSTRDLKNWLNVTAHPLPKDNMWVKYKPDWGKGKEDLHLTSDLRRSSLKEKRGAWKTRKGPSTNVFLFL